MAKLARDDDGLMPKEAAAAKAYASGLNQSESYRRAFGSRSKPSIVHSKASILFGKPVVRERVRQLLRAAKISDVITVGEHIHKMVAARETAFEEKNYTAAASWDKTIAQCLAMTQQRVSVSVMHDVSDEQLVSRIADGDKALAEALGAKLAIGNSFS